MLTKLLLYSFSGAKNPRVFFDIQIDAKPAGRLVFEVLVLWKVALL